jgi:hypothetical protein
MRYEIRVGGHLNPQWAEWFDAIDIDHETNGETLLTCTVVDQAALYGLLRKVRDLGIPLISVIQVEPDQDDAPEGNP